MKRNKFLYIAPVLLFVLSLVSYGHPDNTCPSGGCIKVSSNSGNDGKPHTVTHSHGAFPCMNIQKCCQKPGNYAFEPVNPVLNKPGSVIFYKAKRSNAPALTMNCKVENAETFKKINSWAKSVPIFINYSSFLC